MARLKKLIRRGTKRNMAYEVIDLLMQKQLTSWVDLQEDLGINRAAANRHLQELWVLDLIHIAAWERQHQQWVPAYRWGKKEDVEKPIAMGQAEYQRRYRRRIKTRRKEKTVNPSDFQISIQYNES